MEKEQVDTVKYLHFLTMLSSGSNKRKLESEEKLKVNTDAIKETLWLVKLPEFMGETIANAQHDKVIGTLKVRKVPSAKGSGKPPSKKTTVELYDTVTAGSAGTNTEDTDKRIPSNYILEEKTTSNDVTMLAFSEVYKQASTATATATATSVDEEKKVGYTLAGTVSKSMILLPDDPKYDALLRERSVKTYMRREIQVDDNAIFNFNNMNHIVNFKPNESALLKKQANEADRANRTLARSGGHTDESSLNQLRLKVFEAFSKAERVKQSDLHAFCSQIPSYTNARVKAILEKCARYHQKGAYKHFWELLPEYRADQGRLHSQTHDDA